jgi:16S rRNA (guanine966-N2)-methyltransferase
MADKRAHSVRVIAGEYRGRKLSYPSGGILRPTMDRCREALFSSIQDDVRDAGFVDLFCGAGGVGIEALSRGALTVDFVESHPATIECLRGNLDTLKISSDRYAVHAMDASRFLNGDTLSDPRLKILFADPPYDSDYTSRLLAHLRGKAYDNLELIIIEHREVLDTEPLGRLHYTKTRRFGESRVSFWEELK